MKNNNLVYNINKKVLLTNPELFHFYFSIGSDYYINNFYN